jgi:hypothetical protein
VEAADGALSSTFFFGADFTTADIFELLVAMV